jgi:hypothetical protein
MFRCIVCVFGICFEGDLATAAWTFDVESEYLDIEICFAFYCFFACVELLAFVDVFGAGAAVRTRSGRTAGVSTK